MAPRRAVSRGRSSARGVRRPRAEDVPARLELAMVAYRQDSVDRYNHFGHNGGPDPEVKYVFDGDVPLFAEGSSSGRKSIISAGGYRTLWEIITDAKFTIPEKAPSAKPSFLFGDNVPRENSVFHWEPEYWYFTLGS